MATVGYTEVGKAVCAWLATATGYPCILANQNGPQPVKPYLTAYLRTPDSPGGAKGAGMDETRPTATAGVFKHTKFRGQTWQIQCYSNAVVGDLHACAILETGIESLSLESVKNALCKNGHLAVVPVNTPVHDLSALLETRGESRAMCEVNFNVVSRLSENIGWIEQVNQSQIEVAPVPAIVTP